MTGGSGNLPSGPKAPPQKLSLPNYRQPLPSERPKHPLLLDHNINEPELEEDLVKKRIARQRNADKRFNSPFGFHEPKFKKVSFFQRYPKLTHRVFVASALLLFFSKPIYDAALKEPTSHELERAEFIKKRMQAAGWWDNPFAFWRSSKTPEKD